VYIDDAVDALLTSMQVQSPRPLVINVGTGVSATWKQVAAIVQKHVPGFRAIALDPEDGQEKARNQGTASVKRRKHEVTATYASTGRAQKLLGSEPQVALEEGVERLLAWHYDRAYPYGRNSSPIFEQGQQQGEQPTAADGVRGSTRLIASKGLASCPLGDVDCTLGAPVFYCASSDCANPGHCWGSFWDDVVPWTRLYTKEACSDAVLFTIALDETLASLVPTPAQPNGSGSKSYLKGRCNLAFVSDASPLVRRLLQDPASTAKTQNADLGILLSHGPWTLVPVSLTRGSGKPAALPRALEFLPKWSPSSFFASRVAVYVDPRAAFEDVYATLKEFEQVPLYTVADVGRESEGKNTKGSPRAPRVASTAVLVGRQRPTVDSNAFPDATPQRRRVLRSALSAVQVMAYRMIRIASMDGMNPEAFAAPLDAETFVVHRIGQGAGGGGVEDARLFRCDVLQEMIQWAVADPAHEALSLQFVASLHDLWSRALARQRDDRLWWNMDSAKFNKNAAPAPSVSVKKEASQGGVKNSRKDARDGRDKAEEEEEDESEAVGEEEEGTPEVDDAETERAQGKKSAQLEELETDGATDQAKKELTNDEAGSAFVLGVGGADAEDEKGFAGGREDLNKRDVPGVASGASGEAAPAADDEEEEQATLNEEVAVADEGVAAKKPNNEEVLAVSGKSGEKPDLEAEADNPELHESDGAAEAGVEPEVKPVQQGTTPKHRRLLETQSGVDVDETDPGMVFPGMPKAIQEAVRSVFGDSSSWAHHHASISVDDFHAAMSQEASSHEEEEERAKSQYQTHSRSRKSEGGSKVNEGLWMGVLSSSKTQYLCRIVPFESLGLMFLDDSRQSTT
jgi:hypothetical protein